MREVALELFAKASVLSLIWSGLGLINSISSYIQKSRIAQTKPEVV